MACTGRRSSLSADLVGDSYGLAVGDGAAGRGLFTRWVLTEGNEMALEQRGQVARAGSGLPAGCVVVDRREWMEVGSE